jgi:serine/threonine-protein kinase
VIPGTFEPDGPAYAPGSFAAPFFSPDGKWIGFFARDGLKKIGIAGGTPVPIHASPSPAVSYAATTCGASWSADNTILFGQAGGIMRIPADGGIPELIVPAGKDEQLCRPQVLPGGDAVLFTVMKVGSGPVSDGDIAVHSLASGKRSVIVRGGVDARYLPDGYLVYGVRNTLMAVAFDPGRAALTGDAVSIAQGVQRPFGLNAAGIHFAVSDRGTLIYLADNPQKRSLRWVNRDRTPADPIDAVPPGALQDPRLSPDGGRVLVTRDLDIWIYELASGRASRITNDGHSQMAVWDPTGTRVAFSTINGSDAEAWIAPADGSAAPRQLTDKGGQVHVDAWSPDGRTISVHRHAPSSRAVTILMISVDGPQQPVAFAERDSPAESVCFARDGRYVAYTAAETGQREIYIRPYPGPGGRITVSANGGTEPRWAANGEVFYRNAAGDRMFSVSTSTTPTLTVGRPSLVFQDAYFIAPSGSPRAQYDVTADGKRFLMVTSAPDGDGGRSRFVVVQNWLDELKSRARSGTPAPGR